MKQKRVKAGILWAVLLVILAGAYFEILLQWKTLSGFWEQSGLRYESGGLSGGQIEAYLKRQGSGTGSRTDVQEGGAETEGMEANAGTEVEIAAWKQEQNQTISVEELGRSATGTVVKVSGNMELVFPGNLKSGSYPFGADSEGCMVSSGLALELFGTEDVVGNLLLWEKRQLRVRGILDLEKPVLAMCQDEKEEQMPFVEIRTKGQSPASGYGQIASGLGLFDEAYVFHGSFYVSVARLLISLPLWVIYFFLSRKFLKWCRWQTRRAWLAGLGKGLVFLGIVAGIYLSVSVTSDFVPAQWSDFGFWGEKASEVMGWISGRRNFPEIYWESEVVGCVERIGCWVLVSLVGIGGMKKRL